MQLSKVSPDFFTITGDPKYQLCRVPKQLNHEILDVHKQMIDERRYSRKFLRFLQKTNQYKMTDNTRITLLLAFIFATNLAVKSQEKPLYSDFTGIKGEATGHIHTEEINGKHWFIDANGYAFFPVGLDHPRFFGNTVDLVSNGDAHACANYGFDILSDMGVNCCAATGGMAQKKSALERGFSYALNIYPMVTPHSMTYKRGDYYRSDPFTKKFELHVDTIMKKSTVSAEQDPHILGLSYGFNPFQLMHKWINHFMASSENTLAKVAIVDEVYTKQYGNISDFNQVYGTTFKSFNEIKIDTSIRYPKSYDPKPDEVVAENDFKKQDFNKIYLPFNRSSAQSSL